WGGEPPTCSRAHGFSTPSRSISRAKVRRFARVAAGPKMGRWQPNSILAPVPAGGVDDAVPQLVLGDHLPEPRALDLAARRLGNGAGLDEGPPRRPMPASAADTLDDLPDHAPQPLDLVGALAHLGHHVQALAARPLALDSHGRRVADAGHAIPELLDVDRDQIPSAQNA